MAGPRGEVAVVGAGLIGLFSAHYLLERGYAVTLLERGDPGGGASRVNGGWVCPARSDPLPSYPVVRDGIRSLVSRSDGGFFLAPTALPRVAGFLTRFLASASPGRFDRSWDELDTLNVRTATLVDELVAAGVIGELSDEGFLLLHPTRAEAEASRDSLVAVARRGLCPEPEPVVGREALLALEPGLGPDAQWGFLHRGDRWLDPSRLVDALAASVEARGARIVTDSAVSAVRPAPSPRSGVTVVTARGDVEASHAVIAAGAWAEDLLRPLGVHGHVTPGKGYSFTIHPEVVPTHVLRLGETHVGVTPLGDRARLVGMVELDGTHTRFRSERVEAMRRLAAPYLAGVDWDACTDERVAPRPLTPDGKPLIGSVRGADQVIVATGHNMLGLSLGPATGTLVADLVEHGPAAAVPAFDPMRFTGRRR
ncbi:MAG: FAD-dependent oxidoreductase [Terracoccus sp.]